MEREIILTALLATATMLASCVISLIALVGLPHDYFRTSRIASSRYAENGVLGKLRIVLKNLIGLALVVVGIVLSLPLVPGPGLLVVAAGIALLDLPARRRLLYKLLSRPGMLRAINRSRAAFSRAPFVLD
jgi:hypothetical protein